MNPATESATGSLLSFPFRLEILAATVLGWLVLYFIVNRRPVDPRRRLDLSTGLDRKIPFVPQLALVYFSTYFFVFQPFLFLDEKRQFFWMLANFASISLISILIHAAVPSKIERVEALDTGSLSGKLIHVFQQICQPHGNFPSMHVALSVPVVAANFMAGGPAVGSFFLAWGVLIALSTLFTKQHYILDVLAGLLGGTLVFALTFWFMLR